MYYRCNCVQLLFNCVAIPVVLRIFYYYCTKLRLSLVDMRGCVIVCGVCSGTVLVVLTSN